VNILSSIIYSGNPTKDLAELGKARFSFAGGFPNSAFFQLDLIVSSFEEALRRDPSCLQYGSPRGYPKLIEAAVQLAQKQDHVKIGEENVVTVSAGQYGLHLIASVLLSQPRSKVIVEAPTYFGALEAFKDYDPQYLSVPLEQDGMDMEYLEKIVNSQKNIKFIYAIPDFQNPTGTTYSLEKRKKLVELASKYGVPVVEDSPYKEMRFKGESLPSILSLFPEGTYRVNTVSKIIAPGLRVGWIIADDGLTNKLVEKKAAMHLFSPSATEATVARYLETAMEWPRLVPIEVTEQYKLSSEAMISSLNRSMPEGMSWTNPEGGFVMWAGLPSGMDSEELLKSHALGNDVSFVPGIHFFADREQAKETGKNGMRLSFSSIKKEEISQGLGALAQSINEFNQQLRR